MIPKSSSTRNRAQQRALSLHGLLIAALHACVHLLRGAAVEHYLCLPLLWLSASPSVEHHAGQGSGVDFDKVVRQALLLALVPAPLRQ